MVHGGKRQNAGRPVGAKSKKTLEREALKDYIFSEVKKNQKEIVEALLKRAKKGEIAAIRELLDRAVGKVKDEVEMSSNEKEPVTFVIRSYADWSSKDKAVTQSGTQKA